MSDRKYVLITPARNEEDYIEETIRSVISQTILPQKWVIVSDGSSDGTDEIVRKYLCKFDFVTLLALKSSENRNFGSKVRAIHDGLAKLEGVKYDYIGNLDGDISFQPDYYEKIISKFENNQRLGIAGGKIYDLDKATPREDISSLDSVGGQIQLFHRRCFEEIGGFLPLKMGGEDTIAEVMARMHGWKVQSFSDIAVFHLRPTGTAQDKILVAKFRIGIREYLYGTHPLFEIIKCIYRVIERPYILCSILRACGYFWASLFMKRRHIPKEVMQFLRQEQMHKLISFSKKLFGNPVF
jgi:glycosyltransferase involved in cell wall biosynthesis